MKKQLVIVDIIVIFLIVGLSGCNEQKSGDGTGSSSDISKFVGT